MLIHVLSNVLSIQVHPTSPYKCITLIKSIDTSDSTASVRLKKFMHIQSVNGLLLDGLSSHIASETIRHIEQGPVFLMVRPASKDRSKLTSPATPLTDTPLGTPGRTPPGLPSSLPPQPPPPPVYKGVCRLIKRPFELKWTERPIEVQLRTETLHLIPALITVSSSSMLRTVVCSTRSCTVHTCTYYPLRGIRYVPCTCTFSLYSSLCSVHRCVYSDVYMSFSCYFFCVGAKGQTAEGNHHWIR